MRSTVSSPGRSIKTAFMAAEPTGWAEGGPPRVGDLGLIAPLGGLVVIALFYMRRIAGGAAASAWGGAWLALYLAGTIQTLPDAPPILVALGQLLGTLFPALLYAGAIAFRDGGPLPRSSDPSRSRDRLGARRALPRRPIRRWTLAIAVPARAALLASAPRSSPGRLHAGAARSRSRCCRHARAARGRERRRSALPVRRARP